MPENNYLESKEPESSSSKSCFVVFPSSLSHTEVTTGFDFLNNYWEMSKNLIQICSVSYSFFGYKQSLE